MKKKRPVDKGIHKKKDIYEGASFFHKIFIYFSEYFDRERKDEFRTFSASGAVPRIHFRLANPMT